HAGAAWLQLRPSGAETSRVISVLARLGDHRALPALHWLLQHDRMPSSVAADIEALGPAAASMLPSIRQRIRNLTLPHDYYDPRVGLLRALGTMGEAAAPAVPDLLALDPSDAVLETLGRIGPAAAEAAPKARLLAAKSDHPVAALALWRIDADPDPALRTFGPQLDAGEYEAVAALRALQGLGPAAAPLAPRLRQALDSANDWLRHEGARLWWRI